MKAIQFLLGAVALATTSAVFFCLGREYEAYYYDFDGLFEAHQELRAKYENTFNDACHMSAFIQSCKEWYEEDDTMSFDAFDKTEQVFIDEYEVDLTKYNK